MTAPRPAVVDWPHGRIQGMIMRMTRTLARALPGLVAATLISVTPVRAADTVIIGTVGSPSANLWPLFIGIDKGFFTAENVKVDLIYIPASANAIQQLAAKQFGIGHTTVQLERAGLPAKSGYVMPEPAKK